MRDIAFIVEDIVNSMDNVVKVNSISGNDITVCNPKWASVDKVVTDSLDNEYKVVSVDHSAKVIELNPLGAYSFTGNVLNLKIPIFYKGTNKHTNQEWSNAFRNDIRKKTPFIWLLSPTKENTFEDNKTNRGGIERDSNIRVLFIDQNIKDSWSFKKIHELRLQSLYNMRSEFINSVISNFSLFESIKNSTVEDLENFGSLGEQGFISNIIDADLTGVASSHTLSIYRRDCVNC